MSRPQYGIETPYIKELLNRGVQEASSVLTTPDQYWSLREKHLTAMSWTDPTSLCYEKLASRDYSADNVLTVLVMGASGVGKTCLINQFLYGQFSHQHQATEHEIYQEEVQINGRFVTLDIKEVGGTCLFEFSAFESFLLSADVIILLYSVDNLESFETVANLRDMVMQCKGPDVPIAVVGNKNDLKRMFDKKEMENLVHSDWGNAYFECNARVNVEISKIFSNIFEQVEGGHDFCPSLKQFPQQRLTSRFSRRRSKSVDPLKISSPRFRRRRSMSLQPVTGSFLDIPEHKKRKDGRRKSYVTSMVDHVANCWNPYGNGTNF